MYEVLVIFYTHRVNADLSHRVILGNLNSLWLNMVFLSCSISKWLKKTHALKENLYFCQDTPNISKKVNWRYIIHSILKHSCLPLRDSGAINVMLLQGENCGTVDAFIWIFPFFSFFVYLFILALVSTSVGSNAFDIWLHSHVYGIQNIDKACTDSEQGSVWCYWW